MSKRVYVVAMVVAAIAFMMIISDSRAETPAVTPKDDLWVETTRALDGVTDQEQIKKIIDEKIPGFLNQLTQDAKSKCILQLWGMSRNIDESNMKPESPTYLQKTVPANILKTFASILDVHYDPDFVEGHAGLTHTYGYLFSNMLTPFGYKRLRYVAGENEEGFGLPEGLLGGQPKEGTLLSNLTLFAGTIAFRDNTRATVETIRAYMIGNENPSKALGLYDYSQLKPKRLVEVVSNENIYLEIRTDIVPYLHKNTHGTNAALLIYSIDFHQAGQAEHPKLITAFPVDAKFADGLFNPANLGENKTLKLSYNAVLPVKLSPNNLVGKRFIQE